MPGEEMTEGAPIPIVANLLLCEYAEITNERVFIGGGGVMVAPPAGSPWFLAGTLDVPAVAMRDGFKLSLLDANQEQAFNASDEPVTSVITVAGVEDVDVMAGPRTLRVPVVLRLPGSDQLPSGHSGILYWEFSGDGVRALLPFQKPDTSQHGADRPA